MQMAAFDAASYNGANLPPLLGPGFNAAKKRVALNPLNGDTFPEAMIGQFAPGAGDPSAGMVLAGSEGVPAGLYSLPALAAAPRVGFAWNPSGKG